MRALRTVLVVAALLAVSAGTAQAQNLTNFREAIKKLDPQGDFVLKTEAEDSLAWVYVADVWYATECYQRERIADNLRKLWQATGGNQIVIKDRAGKTVADFKVFSSGWKLKGCS